MTLEKPAKLKVVDVTFEGNAAFSEARLLRTMITRPSRFLSTVYYYENIYKDDLASLVSFYQRNGYLEARVIDQQVNIDSLDRNVQIHIKIEEGEVTIVDGISLFGNQHFDETQLMKLVKLKVGEPLQQEKIQDTRLRILTHYANNGFLDAEVSPEIKINYEAHRAYVDLIIVERAQFTIDQINVVGIEKTKQRVVHRELLFEENEIIQYSQLLKSQRKLYLTGLFQSVFIHPRPAASGDSTQKDILIEIKENYSGEFNVMLGYGSIEKIRTRIEIFNTNISGTARKLGLTTKLNFIHQGVEASFTEPWLFGRPWRFDANFRRSFFDEPGYDLDQLGARFTIGRTFFERSNVALIYRYENNRLKNIRTTEIPDKFRSDLRTLKLTTIFDNRDNMFNTTRGVYLEWGNELAGSFLSGTDTFVRTLGRLKYFRRLADKTVLATSLDIGWMKEFGKSKGIPLNERFYAGGPNSLRGFPYHSVGPLDINRVEVGGNFKLVMNLVEIRRPIYKMVSGALFIDAGNVWRSFRTVHLSDIRIAPGLGLRLDTPIGVVRFDYGFNVFPKPGEAAGAFFVNIGQAF
ncbi:MAG: outer membrane protein assembly factor BamA [bacterium]|nr:outer membrane protein assembly factor BamA [bacterium]